MRQRYDFGYFLSEGFHSIFTHGFMSFAAVCMIICCLLIMGSFTLVAVNAENMFSDLEAENQFTAYIDESLTQEEAEALQDDIEAVPNVARAEFMTKEQAQRSLRRIMRATSCLTACPPMCTGTGSTSIWTTSAS